jgi:transaldolase
MLQTKLFLDSANPEETLRAKILGLSLSGQTTNPSLVIKNPKIQKIIKQGKVSSQELMQFYKQAIIEILEIYPTLDVSVEVYADLNTTFEEMLQQAKAIDLWNLPNLRVKFPSIKNGLLASLEYLKMGGKVNMTLIFNQFQVAAIEKMTKQFQTEDNIIISPFVGRLDDIQKNGMDLIFNIQKMLKKENSKIQILAASIRHKRHLQECLKNNVEIITAPLSALQEIVNLDLENIQKDKTLQPIKYEEIDFSKDWQDLYQEDDLTTKGLIKFAQDWNSVLL